MSTADGQTKPDQLYLNTSIATHPTLRITRVPLGKINYAESRQVRARMNAAVIAEFAAEMSATAKEFEPIDLFAIDEDDHWIGDGWHRVAAAKQKGLTTFPARVHLGSRIDAVKFALSANANQKGQRWSTADKRQAISVALSEFPRDSDRKIAGLVGVSDKTVAAARARCGISAPATVTTADGRAQASKKLRSASAVRIARSVVAKLSKLTSADTSYVEAIEVVRAWLVEAEKHKAIA